MWKRKGGRVLKEGKSVMETCGRKEKCGGTGTETPK